MAGVGVADFKGEVYHAHLHLAHSPVRTGTIDLRRRQRRKYLAGASVLSQRNWQSIIGHPFSEFPSVMRAGQSFKEKLLL
jgi:hypothetical protein